MLMRVRIVQEKKYTEEHEWIELSEDGKTGSPALLQPLHIRSLLIRHTP